MVIYYSLIWLDNLTRFGMSFINAQVVLCSILLSLSLNIFNMEPPKYNGTLHPEEWLKRVQTYCYLKEIENEQRIFKICKLLIDSTIITIPAEINSFDEL